MSEPGMADAIKELRAIKLLLVLQAMNAGTKQKQIAQLLGVSEATMSRMMPRSSSGKSSKSSEVVEE